MKERLLRTMARIDALPRRERLALAGGLIALAIGVQALWVAPTRAKRLAIAESSAESARSQHDAELAATTEASAALGALRERNAALETKLAALGLKASQREPVGAFVNRALLGDGVRLGGLTALPVEELTVVSAMPSTDPSTSTASADPQTPAVAPPLLYRHRTELLLEGPVKNVLRSVEQLESQLVPLRVERIRLVPSGNAGAIQASLILTTISEERTWLAF